MPDLIELLKQFGVTGAGWLSLLFAVAWGIPRKNLDWSVTSVTQIISNKAADSSIQVTFQNETVTNPYLVQVALTLTGNRGMQEKDYNKTVTASLIGKGMSVKAAWLVDENAERDSLTVIVSEDGVYQIELPKRAFNSKEKVLLNLLTQSKPEALWITGHILDCPIRMAGIWTNRDILIITSFIATVIATSFLNPLIPASTVWRNWILTLEAYVGIAFGGYLSTAVSRRSPKELGGLKCLKSAPKISDRLFWSGPQIEYKKEKQD